jgi:hydroxyethylthiazole kinase
MFDQNLARKAAENLKNLRKKKPLIHNITNFVVMNYTANALLACGVSPVMAHAPEEVEEMVSFAGALVLNIGTLTPYWIDSMLKAGKKANQLKVPIILDPVGSGATKLRTESAKRLIDELSIQVVRGNASEVLSLAHEGSRTKGVDSIHSVDDAADAALILAKELNTTLAITGKADLITDGERIYRVSNGHELMGYVTGTGCTATVIIGAFLAVDPDPVTATTTGLAYFGLAGEKAAAIAQAPGSFMIAMLDSLYTLDEKDMEKGAKIHSQ